MLQNLKTKNNLLQELSKDSDGLLLLCLIREFLDYYGLSFTASVFDPELASYGIECDCKDYLKLGNQLKLTENSDSKIFSILWLVDVSVSELHCQFEFQERKDLFYMK